MVNQITSTTHFCILNFHSVQRAMTFKSYVFLFMCFFEILRIKRVLILRITVSGLWIRNAKGAAVRAKKQEHAKVLPRVPKIIAAHLASSQLTRRFQLVLQISPLPHA